MRFLHEAKHEAVLKVTRGSSARRFVSARKHEEASGTYTSMETCDRTRLLATSAFILT